MSQADSSGLAAALEEKRKSTQRQIQTKVAELRSSGADADAIKKAVTRIKRQEQREVEAIQKKHARRELGAQHEVIIIPVLWRRHEREALRLEVTANNLKQALMSAGLNAWVDARRQYTPGQKFAYWEHLGVKLRVEIGPEELKNSTCKIVKADKPGAYLEHRRVDSVPLNARSVLEVLHDLGLVADRVADLNRISDELLVDNIPDFPPDHRPDHVVADDDVAGNVAVSNQADPPNKPPRTRVFGNRRPRSQQHPYRR